MTKGRCTKLSVAVRLNFTLLNEDVLTGSRRKRKVSLNSQGNLGVGYAKAGRERRNRGMKEEDKEKEERVGLLIVLLLDSY